MAAILRMPLKLPFKLAKFLVKLTSSGATRRRRSPQLPVAGLEQSTAHPILTALRQASRTDEEGAVADQWQTVLALAQAGSDRLLHDLAQVEDALVFWNHRLDSHEGHVRFLLLGQGPVAFAKAMQALVHQRSSELRVSATSKIERRVIVLRGLRTCLAEALALVTEAAGKLYLQGNPADHGALFSTARESISACASSITQALEHARQAVEGLVDPLERHTGGVKKAQEAAGLAAIKQMLHSQGAVLRRVMPGGSPRRQSSRTQPESTGTASGQLQGRARGDKDPAGVNARAWQAIEEARSAVYQDGSAAAEGQVSTPRGGPKPRGRKHAGAVHLPANLMAPSKYCQYWIRYSCFGLVSLWGGAWLLRHSRLVGSPDLERWTMEAGKAVAGAFRQHVVAPLVTIRNDLFATLRTRPSIVSMQDFEADKASLLRMLADFQTEQGGKELVAAAKPDAAASAEGLPGMDFLMQRYESELKKPIRSIVSGQLARSLLIQVQKLKVDTESAMLEMDQILKANELSIALVAAIPALIFASLGLYGLARWLRPAPPDPRVEALPCRMAMIELSRSLARCQDSAETSSEEASPEALQDVGLALLRLHVLHAKSRQLFERHRLLDGRSEWPNMRRDLLELGNPLLSPHDKLRLVKRMRGTYTLFSVST